MANTELSAAERRDLGEVARTVVPADAASGMPGAADPAILADIARSIGRDLPLVRQALAAIRAKAAGNFADLDRDKREALINEWYAAGGAAVALGRAILAA